MGDMIFMIEKNNIPFKNVPPTLRWADENDLYATSVDSCKNCKYSYSEPLAGEGCWCAKYPSQCVNCSIGQICDEYENRREK